MYVCTAHKRWQAPVVMGAALHILLLIAHAALAAATKAGEYSTGEGRAARGSGCCWRDRLDTQLPLGPLSG
ncbi:hypothetical protein E2C01_039966 [Portunus trituberculatus]|uniref:Uncharacterized protein n=1 Tax=Portunus trituberculatus TaxID=210409 RepID=A0A5B7FIE1_PORTR|nr:hypothetical protein [Portunus trituberculatus]